LVIQESYGRAKETHAHTQALWEKEIRRARKETFKSQSVIIKLQEELTSARTAVKSAEELLDVEKERSKTREQEAFTARYSLVGMQEQLEQSQERIKMLEQERDAFKTLAQNQEDIARIAAEGRLPLPQADTEDDEFTSPQKQSRVSSTSIVDIKSSATSEAEIEELTMLWQWEKHRAERALEHVDFLQTECELNICACAKRYRQQLAAPTRSSLHRKRPNSMRITDPGDLVILGGNAQILPVEEQATPPFKRSKTERLRGEQSRELRQSTVFVPTEGIFRTVSQAEAEVLNAASVAEAEVRATTPAEEPHVEQMHVGEIDREECPAEPTTPSDANLYPPNYARTPSVEPPDFAMLAKQRTSLLSLLNAPYGQHSREAPLAFSIPTTPGPAPSHLSSVAPSPAPTESEDDNDTLTQTTHLTVNTTTKTLAPAHTVIPAPVPSSHDEEQDLTTRPHTAAAFYTSTTITTTIPLKDQSENRGPSLSQRILAAQRTPKKAGEEPSWDTTNPALTPTMTREQALAQIRERRARSGAVTPQRQMLEGVERRDVSAPVGRTKVVTPGRRVRS
jgi:hypothetical protein